MTDWFDNDIVPTTLDASHTAGAYIGENGQICAWPLRPLWTDNGTTQNCVFDQASCDTWVYDFSAYKLPLYWIRVCMEFVDEMKCWGKVQ